MDQFDSQPKSSFHPTLVIKWCANKMLLVLWTDSSPLILKILKLLCTFANPNWYIKVQFNRYGRKTSPLWTSQQIERNPDMKKVELLSQKLCTKNHPNKNMLGQPVFAEVKTLSDPSAAKLHHRPFSCTAWFCAMDPKWASPSCLQRLVLTWLWSNQCNIGEGKTNVFFVPFTMGKSVQWKECFLQFLNISQLARLWVLQLCSLEPCQHLLKTTSSSAADLAFWQPKNNNLAAAH